MRRTIGVLLTAAVMATIGTTPLAAQVSAGDSVRRSASVLRSKLDAAMAGAPAARFSKCDDLC